MLSKGRNARLIKGMIPDLIDRGLTHLQYIDDTIICMDIDKKYIASVKFLLYCFENMSRLKINYHKSEIIVLGSVEMEHYHLNT
jgi:hypothetical protein